MNKLVSIGILFLLGFLAYGIGMMLSGDKETVVSSPEMEVSEENNLKGIELPQRDPDVRGRIVSMSEKYLILSQSTLENTLTEEERMARRESMQSMSDAEREAIRSERTTDRDANTEQVRIGFTENIRFLEDSSLEEASPREISWEDIQEDANVSIWTEENTTDMAVLVLVRQRLAN